MVYIVITFLHSDKDLFEVWNMRNCKQADCCYVTKIYEIRLSVVYIRVNLQGMIWTCSKSNCINSREVQAPPYKLAGSASTTI